jgi:glycosyltransferase involved in cell wall biosynthesis
METGSDSQDHLPNALFVVWGPPRKGPRSAVMAHEFGIPILFTASGWRPGVLTQPFKYGRHFLATLKALGRRRPRVVFVQSPPTLAVWTVAAYAAVRGGAYVIDFHSDAFLRMRWVRPRWLNNFVARRAAMTLVTDAHWAAVLSAAGARVTVLPDVPTDYRPAPGTHPGMDAGRFNVAVVNTWAPDEPLDEIFGAAARLPDVTFHVTGSTAGRETVVSSAPANVEFVGFLPQADYLRLLGSVDAVMCLTTGDHTMQRGACEALSLARPIVTSDWPLLRDYFSAGTVHVRAASESIAEGVRRIQAGHEAFVEEIHRLRDQRRAEWLDRRRAIKDSLG